MRWTTAQGDALAELVRIAFDSLIAYPIRRFGIRDERVKAHALKISRELDEAMPKLNRAILARLSRIQKSIKAPDGSPVLDEFTRWVASAAFESLARQAIAARVITRNPSEVATRLLGPVSLSLRIGAPTLYASHKSIVQLVAEFVADSVNALIDSAPIDLSRIDYAKVQHFLMESCNWQLESIQYWIRVATEPGIRIDDLSTFPDRYRRAVTTAFSRLPTPHWDGEPRVPVEKVYVPATFSDGQGNEIAAPFKRPHSRHVVVLGDPGAGKTAFASQLVFRLASDAATIGTTLRNPFLIVLRDYRRMLHERHDGLTFSDFLAEICAEEYQVRPPAGAIEFLLCSGMAMVVFDGLDEILDLAERRMIVQRIEVFSTLYPNAPVLVTSRKSGYDKSPLRDDLFACNEIEPFNEVEIKKYVNSWFALDEDLAPGIRRRHQRTFLSNLEGLDRKLVTNPLTLALLCNLSKADGHRPLPKSRSEIFQRCSLMLYQRWDYRRGIVDVDFERDFLPVIAYAANEIFGDARLETGFTEAALIGLCMSYLMPRKFVEREEAHRYARSLIEHCVGRAWVFSAVGTSADAEELFNFTHRTFLEYFAAVHLVRTNDTAEELATELVDWIVRSERIVITQMAFEIKSRQSDNFAEDFFVDVLRYLRSATASENTAGLEWLRQEATVVPIGQSVLRAMIAALFDLPSQKRNEMLVELIAATGENRRAMDRAIIYHIDRQLSGEWDGEWSEDTAGYRSIIDRFLAERFDDTHADWMELSARYPRHA